MTGLGDATWPDLEAVDDAVLLVPLGSTEQHGPHLPLDTDTRIATAVAVAAASHDDRLLVAPALAYGASGEHADFRGTLSIGTDALFDLLVELVRSAVPPFVRVVLVNGHGGNEQAVAAAVRQSIADRRDTVAWWPHVAGGDAHAGRTETSLMLAIAPDSVRLAQAAAGATTPLETLAPLLRADGIRAHAPSGVLGDPSDASAREGAAVLAELAADLADAALVE